ncbi:Zn-ribbon domain-containing OB-fold protein [Rhodococcoides kyotonense]|uniref:ChsH2 C-terminal OB-fold domain-containing protein n=1 Tax=Rhodococcoides kyotonense TaxID=398843 RepID=A0A239DT04_9NOCA|nr:OB-fold domain-containing protein [Rhodococcus kyotonensis]SNS35630.1 hypothetical protein SAMN05421642_10229 [Rhodococcus kyotonensis]
MTIPVDGRITKRRPGAVKGGLAVADSRPVFRDGRVHGLRCTVCRNPSAQRDLPWCPVCRGSLAPDTFSPSGRLWASTLVAIPVGNRTPPFALGYIDLDDGPRVLAHLAEPTSLPIDTRVTVTGLEFGDLVAEVDS